MWRKVEVSDHAYRRWHERFEKHKNKAQLADMVHTSMISQERLGIDNIENRDGLEIRLTIPSYDCEAVIGLKNHGIAKWIVKTFWPLK